MARNNIPVLPGNALLYFLTFTLLYSVSCKSKVEPVVEIGQMANLQNEVDIRYSAVMRNLNEANRTVYHNGVIINEKKVGNGYTEVLTGLPKGKYGFELRADDKVDSVGVTVPEYLPEINYDKWSALEKDIEKNSEINLDMKGVFYDRNVEDTNVPIVGVKSLDGKTEVSLKGDSLSISQKPDNFGPYQVEVEFGSEEGGLAKKVLSGYLKGADEIVFMGMVLEGDKYNYDIYKMKLDGSSPVRLTTDKANDLSPSYSPDGKKIAFLSGRSGDRGYIYTMNTDGSEITKIDLSLDYIWSPEWGPDGRIAFTYRENGLAGIAVVNSDGTGYEHLVEEPESSRPPGGPSWSPDGTKIAYSEYLLNRNREIYVMNSDGTNKINLTNSLGREQMASWSPDGSKIIFGRRENDNWNLYSMQNDGTNEIQLTNDSGNEKNPVFSPDGKRIVFSYSIDNLSPQSLYIMNNDGTNWEELTNFISDTPDFKPN